ncbi:GreA/GreB family elongation factor [Rhizobium hidalgonense]|uniref:GreA/GreB family elongation factor n=1 Tax=Rhizobium hidalgonense TaxID=1538159 RepID=UPI0031B58682
MKTHSQTPRKPPIVIGDTDYRRLNKLALAAADRLPEISDALLLELERARVASDSSVPEKVVRMGSAVEYKTDAGAQRIVTLVFPEDADISEGKISILTPSALPFSACPRVKQWAGPRETTASTSSRCWQ